MAEEKEVKKDNKNWIFITIFIISIILNVYLLYVSVEISDKIIYIILLVVIAYLYYDNTKKKKEKITVGEAEKTMTKHHHEPIGEPQYTEYVDQMLVDMGDWTYILEKISNRVKIVGKTKLSAYDYIRFQTDNALIREATGKIKQQKLQEITKEAQA
jgi:hypothetical protein